MPSFVVLAHGKRHNVNVTPTSPLSGIVIDVLHKLDLDVDTGTCKLTCNNKVLDLATPVRFSNLPGGSKLELHTGHEQPLGLSLQNHASPSASQATVQRQSAEQPNTTTAEASGAAVSQQRTSAVAAQPERHAATPAASLPENAPASTAPSQSAIPVQKAMSAGGGATAAQHPGNPPSPGPQPAARQEIGMAEGAAAHACPEPASSSNMLGLGRSIHIFSQAAAEAADAMHAASSLDDPPDSFYEFTPDDYHRVMAGYSRSHAQESGPGLMTKQLREAEERRRAQQFGLCAVRVQFPDGLILQASFQPLETLTALHQLIARCLAPGIARWQLYTTPPKQVLSDQSLTFYKAGLLPAAIVHWSATADGPTEGPFLRDEVLAMQGDPPARDVRGAGLPAELVNGQAARPGADAGNGVAGPSDGSGAGTSTAAGPGSGGGAQKPRWLKLGK